MEKEKDVDKDFSTLKVKDYVDLMTNVLVENGITLEKLHELYTFLKLKRLSWSDLERKANINGYGVFYVCKEILDAFGDSDGKVHEILVILDQLELTHTKIQIENKIVKKPEESNSKPVRESFFYGVGTLCTNFTGRKDELQKLEELVLKQASENSRATVLTSVSGMGGIGKTTLARQFAYEFRTRGNVFWIPTETKALVQSAFEEIQKELRLEKTDDSLVHISKEVYKAISKYSTKSLFIFDNLDDPEGTWISEFMPSESYDGKIHLLITSRRRDFAGRENTLDLDVFSKSDAYELIKLELSELSDELNDKLASKLGFFPLALRIATANIKRLRTKNVNQATEDYLKTFTLEKEKILASTAVELGGYHKTTYASLKMSIDKLKCEVKGGEILNLLGIFSFLYPDQVEKKILSILTENSEIESHLELLSKYSLINYFKYLHFKIHRLVQNSVHLCTSKSEKDKIIKNINRVFSRGDTYMCYKYRNHLDTIGEYRIQLQKNNQISLGSLDDILTGCIRGELYKTHCSHQQSLTFINQNEFTISEYYLALKQERNSNENSLNCVETKFEDSILNIFTRVPLEDELISTALLFTLAYRVDNPKKSDDGHNTNWVQTFVNLFASLYRSDDREIIWPQYLVNLFKKVCSTMGMNLYKMNEKIQPYIKLGLFGKIGSGSIEIFFAKYLNQNRKTFLETIVTVRNCVKHLEVSKDLEIFYPIDLLNRFEWDCVFETMDACELTREFDLFKELSISVPNLTYGQLWSTCFFRNSRLLSFFIDLYPKVQLFKSLVECIPHFEITSDLTHAICKFLSRKTFLNTHLPTALEPLKAAVIKNLSNMNGEFIKTLTICSIINCLQIMQPDKFNTILKFCRIQLDGKIIVLWPSPKDCDSKFVGSFYLDPLISYVFAASASTDEYFFVFQSIASSLWKLEDLFEFGQLIYHSCQLYYKAFFETKEFDENVLLLPLRLCVADTYEDEYNVILWQLFVEAINSSQLSSNSVVQELKIDLEKCFEDVGIVENELDFEKKLTAFLKVVREYYKKIRYYKKNPEYILSIEKQEISLVDKPILRKILPKLTDLPQLENGDEDTK